MCFSSLCQDSVFKCWHVFKTAQYVCWQAFCAKLHTRINLPKSDAITHNVMSSSSIAVIWDRYVMSCSYAGPRSLLTHRKGDAARLTPRESKAGGRKMKNGWQESAAERRERSKPHNLGSNTHTLPDVTPQTSKLCVISRCHKSRKVWRRYTMWRVFFSSNYYS